MGKPTTLHDDSIMPFGTYEGKRLGDVPADYWRWFLAQDWSDRWGDLVEYARLAEDDDDESE